MLSHSLDVAAAAVAVVGWMCRSQAEVVVLALEVNTSQEVVEAVTS
jgi:hypothetical protein